MTNRHHPSARRPATPAAQRVTARDLVAMTTAIAGAVTAVANHPEWLQEALKWFQKLST
jgi:hypothetical protein